MLPPASLSALVRADVDGQGPSPRAWRQAVYLTDEELAYLTEDGAYSASHAINDALLRQLVKHLDMQKE